MFSGRIEADAAQATRRVIEFANYGTVNGRSIGDRQASRLQQELIQALVPIADGKSLSEASIRRLLDRARHLTITPHGFDLEAGALVFMFSFWNWAAIASYEVLALAEARRRDSAFPGDLRRCRLESCGKFFFMGDLRQTLRGRPRSLYCSKAHMFEQHSTGNARRVALHREDGAPRAPQNNRPMVTHQIQTQSIAIAAQLAHPDRLEFPFPYVIDRLMLASSGGFTVIHYNPLEEDVARTERIQRLFFGDGFRVDGQTLA
jgi:hypothetical protein